MHRTGNVNSEGAFWYTVLKELIFSIHIFLIIAMNHLYKIFLKGNSCERHFSRSDSMEIFWRSMDNPVPNFGVIFSSTVFHGLFNTDRPPVHPSTRLSVTRLRLENVNSLEESLNLTSWYYSVWCWCVSIIVDTLVPCIQCHSSNLKHSLVLH